MNSVVSLSTALALKTIGPARAATRISARGAGGDDGSAGPALDPTRDGDAHDGPLQHFSNRQPRSPKVRRANSTARKVR